MAALACCHGGGHDACQVANSIPYQLLSVFNQVSSWPTDFEMVTDHRYLKPDYSKMADKFSADNLMASDSEYQ